MNHRDISIGSSSDTLIQINDTHEMWAKNSFGRFAPYGHWDFARRRWFRGTPMKKSWPETTQELTAQIKNLRGGAPEVMKAFSGIAQTASAPKALDGKTKELIALAIAVALRCDDCIAFHAKAAFEHGASQDEVTEALSMAIYIGAGPAVMYASHALEAFSQFADRGT
jgi:AhpD family alkylhydroperoxidase